MFFSVLLIHILATEAQLFADLIDFTEPTMLIVGSRGLGKIKGSVTTFSKHKGCQTDLLLSFFIFLCLITAFSSVQPPIT